MLNIFKKKTEKQKFQEKQLKKGQTCFCYCDCGNELISSNSLIKDTDFVYFKCSKCGKQSKWDFDCPCPILLEEEKNMLILSQDNEKVIKRLINFDNIIYLSINKINIKYTVIIFKDSTMDDNKLKDYNCVLGVYDTEERAKEVLQEIINEYKSQNYLVYDAETGSIKDVNKNIVFIMPKE